MNHPRSPVRSVLATQPFSEPHKLPENFVEDNFSKDNPELDISRLLEEGKNMDVLSADLAEKANFVDKLQLEL